MNAYRAQAYIHGTPADPCCGVTDQIEGYASKTGLFLRVPGVRISLCHIIFGSKGEEKGHRYLLEHPQIYSCH